MEKPEATKDDVGALIERFHAALKGANSHTAPPAKVKAFEEALGACVKADVLSKCNLETPLGAALDTTLHMAKKTAGPGRPADLGGAGRRAAGRVGPQDGAPVGTDAD
jgi:hypothetical protein